MHSVHRSCALAGAGLALLLTTLLLHGLLDVRGLVAGAAVGAAALSLVLGASRGASRPGLTSADQVTLGRLMVSAAVSALVLDPIEDGWSVAAFLALAAIALDGVDGRVARRTGSASPFGARFDMETDAFLILVLSVGAAPVVGPWVVLLGLARYAFVGAARIWPWSERPLPPRQWRKVVAATTAVVLAAVVSRALPSPVAAVASGAVAVLLLESFGRDVLWLWRRRAGNDVQAERPRVPRLLATAAALVLLYVALAVPDSLDALHMGLPVEAFVVVSVLLVVPERCVRPIALVCSALVGASVVLRLLDLGFEQGLGRPFRPDTDWRYAAAARDLLVDAVGSTRALAIALLALVALLTLLVVLPWASMRLSGVLCRRRDRPTAVVTGALTVVALAVSTIPQSPVTARAAASLAQGVGFITSWRSDAQFSAALAARASSSFDLSGLRGKDVVIVFVESYGRVALESLPASGALQRQLATGSDELAQHGIQARSAFLTSPTFGGLSWLAHSTLQSGLWIDSQPRYDLLVSSASTTLATDFGRAGWRTVADVPANERPWPEGRTFYRYDALLNASSVGYHGPKFGYAPVPDQFTLAAFTRAVLTPGHRPVMAEMDLVSSHTPWAPLPQMLAWSQLGDGSVYDGMPELGATVVSVWAHSETVRAAYEQSISYTWGALVSWMASVQDPNLVLVVLGDHEPATVVSGVGSSHDVPVTIISSDARVFRQISVWGWTRGLAPHSDAPVWPMDAFRDRFERVFSGHH